jgi:V-type H+-transporting ATPase subunit H
LSSNQKTLLPVATSVRLPALLQNVAGRKLTDSDVLEDLASLTDMLEAHTKTQATFDQYAAEVESGRLWWSPPHRNASFWTENARRVLEHDNGALPRRLADILSQPWEGEKQVLAVACNDVGWLVKEAPEQRQRLEKFGLKTRVMRLMAEADEAVRWESLRAVGEWLRYSFEGPRA